MPTKPRELWPLGIIFALLIASCAGSPASPSGQNNDLIQKLTITDMCYINGQPQIYGVAGQGASLFIYLDTSGQAIQLSNQSGRKSLHAIISPKPRCDE